MHEALLKQVVEELKQIKGELKDPLNVRMSLISMVTATCAFSISGFSLLYQLSAGSKYHQYFATFLLLILVVLIGYYAYFMYKATRD